MRAAAALLLALTAVAAPQDHPGVDSKRVDDAIKKGVEYLKTAVSPEWSFGVKDSDEFILLTLIHAGVSESEPRFQELLKKVLDSPLETTYEVAVQAMALEELQRVKYQGRIWMCAQFLVDNQCANGQWSYGKPSVAAQDPGIPTTGGGSDQASGGGIKKFGGSDRKEKPKVVRKLPVKRSRDGIAAGDNSNAQYAALGLRACHDAGIILPKDTIERARKWWIDSQIKDAPGKDEPVVTGGKILGVPQGWCYRAYHHNLKYCEKPDKAYAPMTAGAVGALAIYDTLLGLDWKKNRSIQNGLAWLAKHWTWKEVAGPSEIGDHAPKMFLYYHFYAVERAGMLLDLPKIGEHDWYAEGANVILDAQKKNGSWLESGPTLSNKSTWDTCFAILFLKRATRALVASQDVAK
jgi:hypothetical protein